MSVPRWVWWALLALVALAAGWCVFGWYGAGAVLLATGGAAKRHKRASALPKPPAPNDAGEDARTAENAAEAERTAREGAESWRSKRSDRAPRLAWWGLVAAGLASVPTSARAFPRVDHLPAGLVQPVPGMIAIRLPECIPLVEWPQAEPPPGYGLWIDADGEAWCQCAEKADYGEVTRIPGGCFAEAPVLGYTLQAHTNVAGDMANARSTIADLRLQLESTRKDRDTNAERANGFAQLHSEAEAELARTREVLAAVQGELNEERIKGSTARTLALFALVVAAAGAGVWALSETGAL